MTAKCTTCGSVMTPTRIKGVYWCKPCYARESRLDAHEMGITTLCCEMCNGTQNLRYRQVSNGEFVPLCGTCRESMGLS